MIYWSSMSEGSWYSQSNVIINRLSSQWPFTKSWSNSLPIRYGCPKKKRTSRFHSSSKTKTWSVVPLSSFGRKLKAASTKWGTGRGGFSLRNFKANIKVKMSLLTTSRSFSASKRSKRPISSRTSPPQSSNSCLCNQTKTTLSKLWPCYSAREPNKGLPQLEEVGNRTSEACWLS